MENGEPVTVKINVMEFIPDGIDDNNPNGFRIEDLDKIETYPLDIGAMVVPLVPPGNNSFKLYEMPLLDSDFIKKDNYKYFTIPHYWKRRKVKSVLDVMCHKGCYSISRLIKLRYI